MFPEFSKRKPKQKELFDKKTRERLTSNQDGLKKDKSGKKRKQRGKQTPKDEVRQYREIEKGNLYGSGPYRYRSHEGGESIVNVGPDGTIYESVVGEIGDGPLVLIEKPKAKRLPILSAAARKLWFVLFRKKEKEGNKNSPPENNDQQVDLTPGQIPETQTKKRHHVLPANPKAFYEANEILPEMGAQYTKRCGCTFEVQKIRFDTGIMRVGTRIDICPRHYREEQLALYGDD